MTPPEDPEETLAVIGPATLDVIGRGGWKMIGGRAGPAVAGTPAQVASGRAVGAVRDGAGGGGAGEPVVSWRTVGLVLLGGAVMLLLQCLAAFTAYLFFRRPIKPLERRELRVVTCEVCGERLDGTGADMAADMLTALEHLRLLHPGEYGDGPERWPDGTPVVVDGTLEPRDFA